MRSDLCMCLKDFAVFAITINLHPPKKILTWRVRDLKIFKKRGGWVKTTNYGTMRSFGWK